MHMQLANQRHHRSAALHAATRCTGDTRGRRFAVRLLALVVAAALAACGSAPTAPESVADGVAELTRLVNAHRASIGCPSLDWYSPIARVARTHSEDMVRRSFFSHVNPDGETPVDRLVEAGVRWSGPAAENIAASPERVGAVFQGWLGSTGHRRAIENCAFTHHGIGLVEGHWTHLFVANPGES